MPLISVTLKYENAAVTIPCCDMDIFLFPYTSLRACQPPEAIRPHDVITLFPY
jgi:hypothetical protein